MMTSAQVVETSVTITDNSFCQDYIHLYDQTTLSHIYPEFKPFPVLNKLISQVSQLRPITKFEKYFCSICSSLTFSLQFKPTEGFSYYTSFLLNISNKIIFL